MQANLCSQCGANVPAGSVTCAYCGASSSDHRLIQLRQ